jgi:hypothetical protein
MLAASETADLLVGNGPLPLRLSPSLGDARRTARRGGRSSSGRLTFETRLKLGMSLSTNSRVLAPGSTTGFSSPSSMIAAGTNPAPSASRPNGGRQGTGLSPAQGKSPGSAEIGGDAGGLPEQPEAPVPFDPTPTVARPSRVGGAEARTSVGDSGAKASLPDMSAETWTLAPIRWSGHTISGLNTFKTGDGPQSATVLNTLNLQANSFVIAPYIAQWSGSFGLNTTDTKVSSSTGPTIKSDTTAMNYGASVNVFPISRFPLSVNLSHGTTQARTAENTLPTTSTAFGIRQQYRTEDGRDHYTAVFNRNSVSTGSASGSTVGSNSSLVSSLQGSFSTSREFEYEHLLEGSHTLNANFGTSSASADYSGQKSRLFNANLNHAWVVHEDLSINNMLTLAKNRIETFQGNSLTNNDTSVILGTTGFTWRPFEDRPLTLNGGGNFSQTQSMGESQTVDLRSLGGFVSGNYRFNNNLSASGNLSVVSTTNSTVNSLSNIQNASVSYSGDPLKFGNYNYGWGLGGGVSRSASSVGGGNIGNSLSASHNLGRTIIINEENVVNLSASQNLSTTKSQQGTTHSLANILGAAWRANYGERLSANLSANVSDMTTSADTGNSRFRTASLQGSGVYQISSRAAVTMNAALNWNQSITGNTGNQSLNGIVIDSAAPQLNGTFSLGYAHRSPFSIPNLNYNASLIRVSSFSNQTLAGSAQASGQSQESTSMQHLLEYRLGRLSFRLNLAAIQQGGRESASLFASVGREFDGFFDGRWW